MVYFVCTVCHCELNGIEPLRQHLASIKHTKKVEFKKTLLLSQSSQQSFSVYNELCTTPWDFIQRKLSSTLLGGERKTVDLNHVGLGDGIQKLGLQNVTLQKVIIAASEKVPDLTQSGDIPQKTVNPAAAVMNNSDWMSQRGPNGEAYVMKNGKGFCYVCNLQLTSPQHCRQHTEGKNHIKKEKAIMPFSVNPIQNVNLQQPAHLAWQQEAVRVGQYQGLVSSDQSAGLILSGAAGPVPPGDVSSGMGSKQAVSHGVGAVGHGVSAVGHGVSAVGHGVSAVGHGVSTLGHGVGAVGHGVSAVGHGVGAVGHGVGAVGHGVSTLGHGVGAVGHGVGAVGHGVGAVGHGVSAVGNDVSAGGHVLSVINSGQAAVAHLMQENHLPVDVNNSGQATDNAASGRNQQTADNVAFSGNQARQIDFTVSSGINSGQTSALLDGARAFKPTPYIPTNILSPKLAQGCDLTNGTSSEGHSARVLPQMVTSEQNVASAISSNTGLLPLIPSRGPNGEAYAMKGDRGYCYVCQLELTSVDHAQSHLSGKKHKKKNWDEMVNGNTINTSGNANRDMKSGVLMCSICDVPFSSYENANQHFMSEKHKRRERLADNQNYSGVEKLQCPDPEQTEVMKVYQPPVELPLQPSGPNREVNATLGNVEQQNKHDQFWALGKFLQRGPDTQAYEMSGGRGVCYVCNIKLTSPQHCRQHIEGSKHQKRLQEFVRVQSHNTTDVGKAEMVYQQQTIPTAIAYSEAQSPSIFTKVNNRSENAEQLREPDKAWQKGPNTEPYFMLGDRGFCYICNVELTSPQLCQQHIEGSKHIKKLQEFFREKSQDVIDPEETGVKEVYQDTVPITFAHSSSKPSPDFITEASKTSEHAEQQTRSKQDWISDKVLQKEPNSEPYVMSGERGFCYVCNVELTSPQLCRQHIEGSKHLKKLQEFVRKKSYETAASAQQVEVIKASELHVQTDTAPSKVNVSKSIDAYMAVLGTFTNSIENSLFTAADNNTLSMPPIHLSNMDTELSSTESRPVTSGCMNVSHWPEGGQAVVNLEQNISQSHSCSSSENVALSESNTPAAARSQTESDILMNSTNEKLCMSLRKGMLQDDNLSSQQKEPLKVVDKDIKLDSNYDGEHDGAAVSITDNNLQPYNGYEAKTTAANITRYMEVEHLQQIREVPLPVESNSGYIKAEKPDQTPEVLASEVNQKNCLIKHEVNETPRRDSDTTHTHSVNLQATLSRNWPVNISSKTQQPPPKYQTNSDTSISVYHLVQPNEAQEISNLNQISNPRKASLSTLEHQLDPDTQQGLLVNGRQTNVMTNKPVPYYFDGSSGYCFCCSVHLTSNQLANQHLYGQKHKKRESHWELTTALENRLSQPTAHTQLPPESQVTVSTQDSSYYFSGDRGFCHVCNIELTSIQHAKQHVKGKPHRRARERYANSQNGVVYPLHCQVCSKFFSGQESAQQHFTSGKHKSKADDMNESVVVIAALDEGRIINKDGQIWYSCDVCKVLLNTHEQFLFHRESSKHKKESEISKSGTSLPENGSSDRGNHVTSPDPAESNWRSSGFLNNPRVSSLGPGLGVLETNDRLLQGTAADQQGLDQSKNVLTENHRYLTFGQAPVINLDITKSTASGQPVINQDSPTKSGSGQQLINRDVSTVVGSVKPTQLTDNSMAPTSSKSSTLSLGSPYLGFTTASVMATRESQVWQNGTNGLNHGSDRVTNVRPGSSEEIEESHNSSMQTRLDNSQKYEDLWQALQTPRGHNSGAGLNVPRGDGVELKTSEGSDIGMNTPGGGGVGTKTPGGGGVGMNTPEGGGVGMNTPGGGDVGMNTPGGGDVGMNTPGGSSVGMNTPRVGGVEMNTPGGSVGMNTPGGGGVGMNTPGGGGVGLNTPGGGGVGMKTPGGGGGVELKTPGGGGGVGLKTPEGGSMAHSFGENGETNNVADRIASASLSMSSNGDITDVCEEDDSTRDDDLMTGQNCLNFVSNDDSFSDSGNLGNLMVKPKLTGQRSRGERMRNSVLSLNKKDMDDTTDDYEEEEEDRDNFNIVEGEEPPEVAAQIAPPPKPMRSNKPGFRFYCEICKKHMNTKETYNAHVIGKNHLYMLSSSPAPVRHLEPIRKICSSNDLVQRMCDIISKELKEIRPRFYQIELVEKAMKGDCIVYLPTGTGKTLVAVLTMGLMLQENPSRPVLFLVDKVLLVMQQTQYIIKHFSGVQFQRRDGDQGSPLVTRELQVKPICGGLTTKTELPVWKHDVVVTTAAYCANMLDRGHIRWEDFSLVVLDEVHHCGKGHPYHKLMSTYHCQLPEPSRAKVLGLTASPAGKSTVEQTYIMLKNLLTNLGGASIAVVEQFEPCLNVYQSMAKVKPICVPMSTKEKGFKRDLLEYFILCYAQLTLMTNSLRSNEPPCSYFQDARAGDREIAAQLAEKLLKDPEPLSELLVLIHNSRCISETNVEGRNRFDNLRLHICQLLLMIPEVGSGADIDELLQNLSPSGIKEEFKKMGLPCDEIYQRAKLFAEDGNNDLTMFSKLVETLQDPEAINWEEKSSRALVLVRERKRARQYCLKLRAHPMVESKKLRVGHIVGHGKGAKDGGMDVKKQRKVFDNHDKYHILVATSIMEEGIDIQALQLVVCMNPPNSLRALVQMRGRARRQGSHFVVLCSSEEDVEKLMCLQKHEQNMQAAAKRCLQEAQQQTLGS